MLTPWKESYDQPEEEDEVTQLCPNLCDPMGL